MTQRSLLSSWSLTAGLLLGLSAGACNGLQNGDLTCGEDTVVRDGQCVPLDHDCEKGEIVSPRGKCEKPAVFCGEGAEYDFDVEKCVPPGVLECGAGTVERDGVCVAEGPKECGEGTVLSDGVCLLKEQVCGDGTEPDGDDGLTGCELAADACDDGAQFDVGTGECVVVDGVECGEGTVSWKGDCIPQRTAADELVTEATMDHDDGLPITPTTGSSVVFTGTMDDELVHEFELHATGGHWIRVTLYSRGLPSPAFSITDGGEWRRATKPGLLRLPERTFGIPATGSYDLRVTTSLSDRDNADDFGDESWKYVGVVEVVDAPEATSWEEPFDEFFEGDLTATKSNFTSVDVGDNDYVLVMAHELGGDVRDGAVELWSDSGEFLESDALDVGRGVLFDVGGTSIINLHFDAQKFAGSETDFEVNLRGTKTLESGQFYEEMFSAERGDLILMSHRSEEAYPVGGAVFRDDQLQYEVSEILAENQFGDFDSDEAMRQFFYVPEDGDYLVQFENTTGGPLHQFVGTSVVEEVPTQELVAGETAEFEAHIPAEGLENGDWRYVIVDTPTPAIVDGEVAVEKGAPSVSVFDSQGEKLFDAPGFSETNEFEFALETAGSYVLAIRPTVGLLPLGAPELSGGIDIALEGRSVEALYTGEAHQTNWSVDAFDVLTGTISFETGGPVDLRLLNPDGVAVFEAIGVDSGFDLMEVFPGPGEFELEVENSSDETVLAPEVDAEVSTPVEILNVVDDFDLEYVRGSMSKGQAKYYLLQAQADFLLEAAAEIDADEKMALRLWSVDDRELVRENDGESIVDLREPRTSTGVYVLEVVAETDVADGWQLAIDGTRVHYVDVVQDEDPPLFVETSNDVGTSELVVGAGCQEIVDVWIYVDFAQADEEFLSIDLQAPAMDGDDALALRGPGVQVPPTTVFGDETEPLDSLDVLVGESGNGDWELIVENDSCCVEAVLESWGVDLVCLE